MSLFNRPQQTGMHTICCWCGRCSTTVCPRNSGIPDWTDEVRLIVYLARSAFGKSACLAPDTQVDDCVAQPLHLSWWYEDPVTSSQICTLQQSLVTPSGSVCTQRVSLQNTSANMHEFHMYVGSKHAHLAGSIS